MTWEWAYGGVDESIPRYTGPECVEYLSRTRIWLECIVIVAFSMILLKWGCDRRKNDLRNYDNVKAYQSPPIKQFLLIAMTFTLGLELGFKLSNRTVIDILNPCHVTSIVQIYLLTAKQSKGTTALFRIHMNYMNGPLLAFIFPEIESRKVTFEATTYYLQHGLMFIIAIYLLRHGGVYTMEDLSDFSWNGIGFAILLLYHFVFLQIFSLLSHVNLNHILCPALLDPFEGPNYRLFACTHQAILCPALAKLFTIIFRTSKSNRKFLLQAHQQSD